MENAALTLEQLEAVLVFASRHGRYWKSKLSGMWMTGRDVNEPEGPLLRQVRNDLGPSWLSKFSLKGIVTEYRGWKVDVPATSMTGWFRGTRMGVEVDAGDVLALGRIIDNRIQMYPSTLGA